jgi:hypothetical protein
LTGQFSLREIPDRIEREANHDPGRLHGNSQRAAKSGISRIQQRLDVAGSIEKAKKTLFISRDAGEAGPPCTDRSPQTGFVELDQTGKDRREKAAAVRV